MVVHLMLDVIWRSRQTYAFMLVLLGLFWSLAAGIRDPAHLALMASLAMAYVLGPVGAVAMMTLRELRTLPVTGRDLWVATWVTATVVTTLAITAVQAAAIFGTAAITGSSLVSPQAIPFTALYCFAYAGALMPIMPAFGYSLGNIESRRPRWLWITISIGAGLLFLSAFGLPYYFVRFLPLSLEQLWWGPVLAVLACLGLAALNLAWTPNRAGVTRATAVRQDAPQAPSQRPQRFADRLTGIPRVAWSSVTFSLTAAAVTIAAFIAYWAVFEPGTSLSLFLQRNSVLIFETGFVPDADMGDMWITMTLVFVTISSPWKVFARQLKVLPVTAHQINGLFLATPFAQWALVWLALFATHVAVVGQLPSTLRPELFVLLGGASALGQGLAMRYGAKGSYLIIFLMSPLRAIGSRLTRDPSLPLEAYLVAAGLLALAAAAFLNHRTLTRSTSSARIFQRDSLPFGMGVPGAPR